MRLAHRTPANARSGAPHHILHQSSSDGEILRRRIDRNRAHSGDGAIFPKKVAPHYSRVSFGDDRIDISSGQKVRTQPDGNFRRGKIRREIVVLGKRLECFITNEAAGRGIVGPSRT